VTLCALLVEPTTWGEKVKEEAERLAPARAPVPERLTVWVEGLELSVKVSEPLLVPVVVGVKVTLMGQEKPAARPAPHELVWEKSPLTATLVMLRASLPPFVRNTICALLLDPTACAAKVNEVGERLAAVVMPLPVRLTVWVAGLALSLMVIEPLRTPEAVGLKVTLMAQEVPAATLAPQVLVWEKSPLAVMPETARAALPALESVITSRLLEVPTSWLPKTYDDGESPARGTCGTVYLVTNASYGPPW